ncbi:MAG: secreted agglutinin [Parcubacteria group bacterium]|nr:secreted agglutinin [Parcubacteria group bacterium]
MQKAKAHTFIGKIITAYMLVMVIFSSFPAAAFAAGPAVTLSVNGSHGPVTLNSGETFTYSWSSTDATSCDLASPSTTGLATSGTSLVIDSTHPYYPTVGHPTTITVTCTDGVAIGSDSVVVNLAPTAPAIPTVDVKANGSDGPVTLNPGQTFTYTWTSSNATSCDLASPSTTGLATSGTSLVIDATHPYYPGTTTPTTITVTCTNGVAVATDSVVVSLGSGGPVGPSIPTVDVKANGSDGPVVLSLGQTFTYTWVSTNATSCDLASPSTTGLATSGTSLVIDTNHPYYPGTTTPTTVTVTCTNGVAVATDSVVISLAGNGVPPTLPTVDVKANGSDGPVTLNPGQTFTYTWVSTNATSCDLTSPSTTGLAINGTSLVIDSTHPYYPTTTTPTIITVTCTNGVAVATDSVVVGLAGGTIPTCSVANITSSLAVTVNTGDAFTYLVTTANSSTSPVITVSTSTLPAGLSYSTSTQTISGTPTAPGVSNITITSTNNCGTDTKTLVITVNTPGGGGPIPQGPIPPGGGGGGIAFVPGGSRHPVIPTTNAAGCLYLKDYMRSDFNNNPEEVMKLQSFLRVIQGYNYVTVNGVFDQATVNGVDAFQNLYRDDILTPWGHTAPTHYVYILTLKKINEIYCLGSFPLNDAQAKEIAAFKALLQGVNNQGLPVVFTPGVTTTIIKDISTTTLATSSPVELPIVGSVQGQNLRNLAAAIFTAPAGLLNTLQCIYEFLLILIVLYILANVLEDVFIKDTPENVLKKFLVKWTIITLGLTLAIIAAYFYGEWCLLLPLLIILILSVIWMALYPKHSGIKNSTKAWYLVMTARSKSMWKKADSVTAEELE